MAKAVGIDLGTTNSVIAAVEGEWHSRAALSTLFVPRNRATFCAT